MRVSALPILTERTIIRKFDLEDASDIVEFSLAADFWLSRNISWEPTVDSVVDYYRRMDDIVPESYARWLDLVIEFKETNKVIGSVGIGFLGKDRKQAMVGCLLSCQYQGRGIAPKFSKLSFHLVLEV